MFSAQPATRAAYQQLFARRAIRKRYEALAPALPTLRFPLWRRTRLAADHVFFRMCEIAGEPNSETRCEVVERRGAFWRYALYPTTGRKHQLRVHMAALGAPICNDPWYPALRAKAEDDYERPLQLLAQALEFVDPVSGKPRHFASARQLDMARCGAP
jgi:tRNA pseudouridine32 synthase/23S rRNA pseudouridine746 synthase